MTNKGLATRRKETGFLQMQFLQDGYTYTFYMQNMPAPKNYVDNKLSPLHTRVLFMFDQLKEPYHHCGLDNHYISAKFTRAAFIGKNKVMVQGVAQKNGQGLPACVLQEEQKKSKEQEKVRGNKSSSAQGRSRVPKPCCILCL